MADKKITDLTSVSNILDTDAFIIARSGDNYQLTGAGINALIAAATSAPSFRNKIINGSFTVNQRGVSTANTSIAANANTWLDGWKGGPSGATASFAVSGIDNLVTINSGTVLQIIRANQIEGGTYTVSWTGTAGCKVYVTGGAAITSTYAASGFNVTLTANTSYVFEFNTGTVTRVQVELASKPTPFERRDDELVRCQKRFQRHATPPARGVIFTTTTTQAQRLAFMLPVTMDAVPAMSVGGTLVVYDGTNSANIVSVGNTYPTRTSVEFDATLNTGLAAGRPAVVYNTGNGYVDVSCEP